MRTQLVIVGAVSLLYVLQLSKLLIDDSRRLRIDQFMFIKETMLAWFQ